MGNGRTAGHWRETDVRLEGLVVQPLQGAFVENWLEATGVILGGRPYFPRLEARGEAVAQVVQELACGRELRDVLDAPARHLVCPHDHPHHEPLLPPGRAAPRRPREGGPAGRARVVLLPGAIDNTLVRQASRREFGRLMEAGIEIYEYRAGLLHSKTMVVDGVWATVGSTNFDNRSFALNEELNVAIYSRDVAQRLERVFAEDLEHSHRIRRAEWQSRGIRTRVLEWLTLPLWPQL
jgi:cardiolipin synthase